MNKNVKEAVVVMDKNDKEAVAVMNKKELCKRYILFIISLFVAAFGVAVTKRGELGVSPVTSVANVLSMKFTVLSLGNWLIVWNCLMIVGQIVLLRHKFQWIQLLQIPLSFLFGYFTDFGMWILSGIQPQAYWVRAALVVVGTMILGLGVALSVIANVIMNSGEAFVKAIADTIHKDFGNVKIGFDIFCVVFSLILSVLFFDGKIQGCREGTIFAAVCTGLAVKCFRRLFAKKIEAFLH